MRSKIVVGRGRMIRVRCGRRHAALVPVGAHPRRRGRAALLAIAAAAFAAIAGCEARESLDPPRGVLLVVVDTLRADHLGAYGYGRPTSPSLDALAADATVFENAISQAPWTLPAMASLMTAMYPSRHGAVHRSDVQAWLKERDEFRPVSALAEEHLTLAERLKARSFETAAFVRGSYPSRVFGFDQGFDHFADNDVPGLRFNVENLLAWLDERRPERFFVYLHTVEVHSPYTPIMLPRGYSPEPGRDWRPAVREEQARYRAFDFQPDYDGPLRGTQEDLQRLARSETPPSSEDIERLIALYDRGVLYTDYWLGRLFDGLRARGLYDETLIVVTSDHGEEFFDHGGLQHTRTYHEELLRVPLIVRHPHMGHGRRVADVVGLVDVAPTIVAAVDPDGAGFEGPDGTDIAGSSLLPAIRGETIPHRTILSESALRGRAALRDGHWKFIDYRRGELYALDEDPAEHTNLCRENAAQCRALRSRTRSLVDQLTATARSSHPGEPTTVELDEATRARLRALGYAEPTD